MAVCRLQMDHFLPIAGKMLSAGGSVRRSALYWWSLALNTGSVFCAAVSTACVQVAANMARVHGLCSWMLATHYPWSRPVNTTRVHGRSKDALYTSVCSPCTPAMFRDAVLVVDSGGLKEACVTLVA